MKKQLQETDLALFHEHVQDAEPIRHDRVEHVRPKPPPIPLPRPTLLSEADGVPPLSESEVETPEFLAFTRPGIQRRLMAELERGEIAIGLELDLHGLHVPHAREVLGEFLAECSRRRVRCALIVHGKGARSSGRPPVLKQKVNYWLRLHQEVLAFCSARQRDGGTGAVYVLLRNPRKAMRATG